MMSLKFFFIGLVFLLVTGCNYQEGSNEELKHTQEKINTLNKNIASKTNFNDFDLKQSDSLFKLSIVLGFEKGIAESAANYIWLLTEDYQYNQALSFVTDNLSWLEEIKDRPQQALVFEKIGILYMNIYDFDKAYAYLSRVLSYYEENENKLKQSIINSRIGLIFKGVDKAKAMEYLKKALNISYELNDSTGIARDLNNIGTIYKDRNILDTARYYFDQAMIINEKVGEWNYYATNLFNIAILEKENKNFDKAIGLFNDLIIAFDSLNDRSKYTNVVLHLGDLYLISQEYNKAIPYFALSDSIGEKYTLLNARRNGNWGLFKCYSSLGKNEPALKYLQLQYQFEDSLRSQKNIQELARLELQFKHNQLTKEKKWAQQKKSFYLYFLLIILLISAAYLFQLLKKQKLKVAKEQLERKVLQNELQGKERELTTFVLNMIRINEKKIRLINYLKKQKPRLKLENHDIIDTTIRDLEYDQDAQVWDEFEMRFNRVNNEFYQKLAHHYPELTNNEKRLCAFLLMNMNTKDISSITGQSTDAIGKARTRLRKKLGLTHQEESIASVLNAL